MKKGWVPNERECSSYRRKEDTRRLLNRRTASLHNSEKKEKTSKGKTTRGGEKSAKSFFLCGYQICSLWNKENESIPARRVKLVYRYEKKKDQ